MAKNDVFRQAFEAGATFVDLTRERAEVLVKDLVKVGAVSRGKAQKLIDELMERSRQGTDELRALIRREVTELGLATTDDIARIEARLDVMATATDPAGAPTEPTEPAPSTKKASTATKATPAKKAATKKATPAKKAANKKTSPAKKAANKKTSPTKKTSPARGAVATTRASTKAANKAGGATASKSGTRETRGSEGPGSG